MLGQVRLDPESGVPLYRQLADAVSRLIDQGSLEIGDRLPPTRELAGQLGLNRTTISAAYAWLESAGLIRGHVGRGSFVAKAPQPVQMAGLDWNAILPRVELAAASSAPAEISFANSRPADDAFPMEQFRRLAKEVIDSPDAREILQLGSPLGYAPLRRYLLEQARSEGLATNLDDLIVTNGCQQALDLLARVLASRGETVILEDPVYHGLLRVFERSGASIVSVPVTEHGMDPEALESAIARHRPRALVLTPSFQNPTGASIPAAKRWHIVALVQQYGTILIENDIYGELRYHGEAAPALKRLDESGHTILLRSYSKVSFPGLRVGWVIAPRPVIAHLAELKQTSDLHSDQLSQAVLLRFAESGELGRHLVRTRQDGELRLIAARNACETYLPPGSKYTTPEGGMNLWVELPSRLDTRDLLAKVQEEGVTFLPGHYFSVERSHSHCLRLSFGGLSPEEIRKGIRILGETASRELAASAENEFEPTPALV
jgi:DNA-binding transcriptional MocR family regulator